MIVVDAAHCLVISALAFSLWKRASTEFKTIFWPALLLKLAAGVSVGLLYKFYYETGDTFTYFFDGKVLAVLARQDWQSYTAFLWAGDESFPVWDQLTFQQPRAMYLSKITSVFCLITRDNYWIISLYFSFISFCGGWILVHMLTRLDASLRMPASVAILFFPSVVFWTSGLIKESLAMAALYFIVVLFLKGWTSEKVRYWQWVMLPVSLWLLWNLKYYYLA
ncbi:MAG TPA: hypothetical protein VD816_08210, partial [Ohtaekwangia sp.]|nr:hypothetical protein [Ohtaekwangia sp.]